MDAKQLRDEIVRPVLIEANMYSEAADKLLMGTAAVESDLLYVKQFANGPARGLWQMEPATHDDIANNWPSFRKYKDKVLSISNSNEINADNLVYNIRYAALLTRLHYWRKPNALPKSSDIEGLASYWKEHYNTRFGKGTTKHFIEAFKRKIQPLYD